MKKFTPLFSITLLILISFHQVTFAQAQRLVLVEEFTQASCGPCGQQNPAFNALIENNPDKIRSLKYQVSWPGYDPMYLQNTSQVDARVNYYGVSYVPWPWLDGADIASPPNLTQASIDAEYAVPSPFVLNLTHTLSPLSDSIYITLNITAVAPVSGTIKARIAVVEQLIQFATEPGTNGETLFENVMKQMLPSTTGTALPSSMDSGYTTTVTAKWKLKNIYDLNQLAVVAFIQNDAGKSILQAAYSDPLPPIDVATVTPSGYIPVTCTGSITPSATVSNLGQTLLSSATITYSVGTGSPQTYDWNGAIGIGGTSSSFQMPAITVPDGFNTLNANVTSVNGTPFNGAPSLVAVIEGEHGNAIGMGTPATTPIVQDFSTLPYPPLNWAINNTNASPTWYRNGVIGAYQNQSDWGSTEFPFFTVSSGDVDEFYIQNFDFSDVSQTEAYMEFVYAKAKRSGHNDELKVLASSDCGTTWTSLFDKNDVTGNLSSVSSTTTWKPTAASQWKPVVLGMSAFIGQPNVIVKFVAKSGNGNNLYIDDINIHYGASVGIATPESTSLTLVPNPANNEAAIHVSGVVSNETKLEVLNIVGQVIYTVSAKSNSDITVNTSKFKQGLYIYRLNDNGKILVSNKFEVSH